MSAYGCFDFVSTTRVLQIWVNVRSMRWRCWRPVEQICKQRQLFETHTMTQSCFCNLNAHVRWPFFYKSEHLSQFKEPTSNRAQIRGVIELRKITVFELQCVHTFTVSTLIHSCIPRFIYDSRSWILRCWFFLK